MILKRMRNKQISTDLNPQKIRPIRDIRVLFTY